MRLLRFIKSDFSIKRPIVDLKIRNNFLGLPQKKSVPFYRDGFFLLFLCLILHHKFMISVLAFSAGADYIDAG